MTDKYYPQAFPNEGFNHWGAPEKGMTLRDYFAAKALPEVMRANYPATESDDFLAALFGVTREAYEWADAMMKAKEQ